MSKKTKIVWVSFIVISLLIRFSFRESAITEIVAQTLIIAALLFLFWDKVFATQYPNILKIRVPMSVFLLIIEGMTIFYVIAK